MVSIFNNCVETFWPLYNKSFTYELKRELSYSHTIFSELL
uniref:Uncharacterized protein n=1 Tax=Rhizophora mucronata TaxID=61149 RepID=A0A2P2NB90_RHIMU